MARTCGEGSSSSEGFDALLAFPTLEAAAAIVAHTAQREAAPARMPAVPKPPRKIAVFTGSFDPPTTYHRRVAKLLRGRGFDEVIVRPTGPRCEDPDNEHAVPIHRAVMADLAFRDLPGVSVDLADLDDAAFTPNLAFDELYADRGEVWHVVLGGVRCRRAERRIGRSDEVGSRGRTVARRAVRRVARIGCARRTRPTCHRVANSCRRTAMCPPPTFASASFRAARRGPTCPVPWKNTFAATGSSPVRLRRARPVFDYATCG